MHIAAHASHTLLLCAALLTAVYSAGLLLQVACYDFSNAKARPHHTPTWPTLAIAFLLLDGISLVWCHTYAAGAVFTYASWTDKALPVAVCIAGLLVASCFVTLPVMLLSACSTTWGCDTLYARCLATTMLDVSTVTWASGDRGVCFSRVS